MTQHKAAQAEPQKHEFIDWPDGKSPYPGLLWFDEDYAPLFFGRDREVDDLVGKMSEPDGRVLLVSGASGIRQVLPGGSWAVARRHQWRAAPGERALGLAARPAERWRDTISFACAEFETDLSGNLKVRT